jgi:hypothetical protein
MHTELMPHSALKQLSYCYCGLGTRSKIPSQRNFPFCDRGGQLSEDTRLEDLRSLAAAAAAAAAAAVQGERGGEGLSRSGGGGQGMSI